ncbi:MAG: BrnT family toxin [Sphingomicrobium sp.]|nr:BrnT family toxin [Sphingomonadales bacterium]
MKISYHPEKRAVTFAERGLDFEDAATLFHGPEYTVADDRRDYGEQRLLTYGLLENRMVMVVWTLRGDARHIISMRKCNDREKARFERKLD